jgi:hypothetical protein
LLVPQALSSQDFSSLDGDLSALERLIQDTLENSVEQQRQLDDLQRNLAESEILMKNPGASSWVSSFCKVWIVCGESIPTNSKCYIFKPEQAPGYGPRLRIKNYESIITERENLLRDLQIRLNEMLEIYRKQSSLSAKYEKSSRFWKTFTLVAVPAAALLSGGLVWALK